MEEIKLPSANQFKKKRFASSVTIGPLGPQEDEVITITPPEGTFVDITAVTLSTWEGDGEVTSGSADIFVSADDATGTERLVARFSADGDPAKLRFSLGQMINGVIGYPDLNIADVQQYIKAMVFASSGTPFVIWLRNTTPDNADAVTMGTATLRVYGIQEGE